MMRRTTDWVPRASGVVVLEGDPLARFVPGPVVGLRTGSASSWVKKVLSLATPPWSPAHQPDESGQVLGDRPGVLDGVAFLETLPGPPLGPRARGSPAGRPVRPGSSRRPGGPTGSPWPDRTGSASSGHAWRRPPPPSDRPRPGAAAEIEKSSIEYSRVSEPPSV